MQICEFQEMMRRLYIHRDSERGIEKTYQWLRDEVDELGDALKQKNKLELEREFADVIAWLASLANTMGVDLEQAAINKYSGRCPKCESSPCKCTF
jgi:NTP pyrophosphatase (non-canonical NTP hydrolase)